MNSGDINYHHVADKLPVHHKNESPKAVFCIISYCYPEILKNSVYYHLPYISEHDSADKIRHKKDRSENVRTLEALCQKRRKPK